MPIEVRELVIKARVEEVQSNGNSPTGGQSNSSGMSGRDIQKIVAMCAEEVLKVLQRQKER